MKKKILCLAMAVVMAAGIQTTAFAKEYKGADGWQVTFNGSKMNSNFKDSDIADSMTEVQPGDSIELQVNLKNEDSGKTDWYMTNEVVQTLEEAQNSASGGAYEYKLIYVGADNSEKVLYDSQTVGGEGSSTFGEGLKSVDGSLEQYFYLGRLGKGESGTVRLKVGVEGETATNGYQQTLAKLRMNFAVEKVKEGQTINKNKVIKEKNLVKTSSVKTGDTSKLFLMCACALISGLLLLAAGIYLLNNHSEQKKGHHRKGES